MQDWRALIERLADEQFADLVALRRHLHQHPEPSGHEEQTAAHLQRWLADRNVGGSLVASGCGIVVDLNSAKRGAAFPRLALRADMDALRIQDAKEVPYRSCVDGIMHACGHDVHSTILAGALVVLHELQGKSKSPPIEIRGIFQPAEEICQGASRMISAGAIEGVDAIVAVHVDPFRELGSVGLREGVMAASCDELIVTISGKGGHAARPHHTRDPVTAVAQFLNAVHVQIPRGTDSLDTVVVGFGSIRGGDQCNVIPDTVHLRGTLRTLTPETRRASLNRMLEIAQAIGTASQTEINIEIGANAPPVINDIALTRLVQSTAVRTLSESGVEIMRQPSMGGEDFAYYLEKVPGVLMRLGTAVPGKEPTGLHTPNFDVDEGVIRVGVRLIAEFALDWAASNS